MTGCFLVLIPIGILARRCEQVGSPLVTSNWQCIVAATAEELLEKDPDPFKSVADGKYPCFILKRALTNGPQLVRKLVASGVLEGDDLRYGPLASPFDFMDHYPELSNVGYAISQLVRRPELWASLEKLKELLSQVWDGSDPFAMVLDRLNVLLAPSGRKVRMATGKHGELPNGLYRIFRPHNQTRPVSNVVHFDGMDHRPWAESTDSPIPPELRFTGSHTLSVNLILQAPEAYQDDAAIFMYNASRHEVHAKAPHLLWTCRTVGCWFHEAPFKEFAANQNILTSHVALEEGDLYVFSSSRVHQVQHFIGDRYRVTLNFFMAYFDGQQDVTVWT